MAPIAPGGGAARLVSDSGAPPPIVSPAPTGTNLDELMAVVEGESITRRSLVREIGERGPDQDLRLYEEHLHAALLRRAINRIFVKAGEREGLLVTPDRIEDFVKDQKRLELDAVRAQAEKIEKGSGAKITFERLLADRGITMEEYKSEKAKELMRKQYFYVLVHGVPGKRALVDLEPSPEDVRRLYAAHKAELNDKAGARFAIFAVRPFDAPEAMQMAYDDAIAAGRRKAQAILVDFQRDRDAERVANANGIRKGEWTAIPAGQWREAGNFRAKDLADWLFAPARKAGDSIVLEPPSGEIMAVACIEVRPAKTRSFEEVQDAIIDRIRQIRGVRFQEQHTLELLGRAQIWPSRIANELVDQSRDRLKGLDDDPVSKDIRLR